MEKWAAANNDNKLDEKDHCYFKGPGSTRLVLVLDGQGTITGVLADTEGDKTTCFRGSYLNVHFPPPPAAPYYLYLEMHMPQGCDADSQAYLRKWAEAGDKKAEYVLGAQLLTAQCGSKNPEQGFGLLQKSLIQGYAPAQHLMGDVYLKSGKTDEAVALFLQSAQQGFRLSWVSLGIVSATPGSRYTNSMAAYAWLSLAAEHQDKPDLKAYLDKMASKVAADMNAEQLAKAEQFKKKIAGDYGSLPQFNDDP